MENTRLSTLMSNFSNNLKGNEVLLLQSHAKWLNSLKGSYPVCLG